MEDSRDISGLSRFLSGGIGGITSQLSKLESIYISALLYLTTRYAGIYPVETLKVLGSSLSCFPVLIIACPDSNDEQHRRTKTNTKSRHPSPVGTRRASCILPRSYGALLGLCTTDGAPGLTIPYTQIGLVGVFPYVFFHCLLHTTQPTHLLPRTDTPPST